MRWLELLVAGIFTYEVTRSTVLVALVTVARSLPMLFIGTIAGVVGEALNRKRLLLTQLFVMAGSSAVLCALAFSGQIRVWHIAVGGIAAGIVWAMELAVRRRMIGEVVAPDQVAPAVAFDSLTNSFARVLVAMLIVGSLAHAKMAMQTFPVLAGAGPHDVYPAPDGTVWFTAQSAGKLGHLDPRTGKSDLIALGRGAAPHGVIAGPDGRPWG